MLSFQIARIRGIPIRIHITFLIVLPFLALLFGNVLRQAGSFAGVPAGAVAGSPWLWGLGIALALFLSVLVHELAHSLYALRKGGRVKSITLLMIGGVSQLEEPPKQPRQEAMMAFVGPLTSLGLGVLFYLCSRLVGASSFSLRFALFYIGYLNLFLGLFNLLPAFPMDGGRVLRGLLVPRYGVLRATRIAAGVGKGFAIAFGIFGLLTFNIFLLLIAFFVFLGAAGEAQQVVMNEVLRTLRVGELMQRRVEAIDVAEPASAIAERMAASRRVAFPVVEQGQPVGIVSLGDIEKVPAGQRDTVLARQIVRSCPPVEADDNLEHAWRLFQQNRVQQLAVVEGGLLAGTLSIHDVARAVELRKISRAPEKGTRPGPREPAPHGPGWDGSERHA